VVRRAGAAGLRRLALLLALPALLGAAGGRARHPLHTTLTQLSVRPATRSVEIVMRVFVDDFSAAVARHEGGARAAATPPSDSAAYRYVTGAFALTDRGGRRLPLRWGGTRRTGDVVWLTLTAPGTTLDGLRVSNRVLVELYADQVNIVQATVGARRASLLFTRGDGAKALR
jgi:hypothetical protein